MKLLRNLLIGLPASIGGLMMLPDIALWLPRLIGGSLKEKVTMNAPCTQAPGCYRHTLGSTKVHQ